MSFPKGAVLAQMRIMDGKPGFSISSISGPEGMELFSRSCLVDRKTEQVTRTFATHSDFGAAERLDLAHIPSAYGWHTTMRPDYWTRKIAFPGVYADGPKLSCDDAFARVENGIIVLRDRGGKKLLPRVSSAHDMLNAENLPLYRALAIIGVPYAVGFHWPSIFSNVKQLPRIMLGDVWLSPAQWQLTDKERQAILSSASTSTTFRAILDKRGIKGEIEVGSGDRFLPVLEFSDEALSVIMPVLKARDTVIRERFFTSKTPVFQEQEANCAEVVLPFFSEEENRESTDLHFDLSNYSFQATSPHLGNWISFKIYGPRQDIDRNVLNGLATLTERIKDQDYVDQWFFLRFGDPEFHLRFRVKVTSLEYRSDIVSVLGEFLDQLADRCLINRWELATYRPELMRYGGTRTMPVCEQIFAADSKTCWIVNGSGKSDRDLTLTRHFINASVLLDRLELIGQTGSMAADTLSKWQEHYRGSVSELEAVRAEANMTLNDNRFLLEADLSDLMPEEAVTACCASRQLVAKLRSETEAMRTTIDSLALLESLFHMFSNRLYPNWSRHKELMALCIAKRLLNFKIHRAAS